MSSTATSSPSRRTFLIIFLSRLAAERSEPRNTFSEAWMFLAVSGLPLEKLRFSLGVRNRVLAVGS